ncbi:zinc uptake protein ZrgA [Vibrio methylphosphonaticus]|uniref:zinc uptake protein ZrgA n=1 Tax=Vibrio methylphosphonaticus TaxID=2946866 RepID=UPI002029CD0D|nr:DUF2796 domain-containing protein [Vibrio methylphosphonaticus]MCL9777087.1 DUF2796 domain-containing protein [Vibrio methylphosphonaticus]
MKLRMTLLATIIASPIAVANDEFRQHEAHVHGQVAMNIAQDGQDLLFEITAPGADVVGFEHSAKNEAEKQAIADAEALLAQPSKIFTLPSSLGCTLVDTHIEHGLGGHDDHDHEKHAEHDGHDDHDHEKHAEHDGHDDHDHEKHAEHDGHDDHDHEKHAEHDDHDHDHDHDDGHGEFTVQYQFSCSNLSDLSTIETQWFTHFPSTEKVSVNLLTDNAQSASELNSTSTTIQF